MESVRANSRNSQSRYTRRNSRDTHQEGSMPSGSGMKEVSIAPRVGAAVAAEVEETGACAGTKELSGGERFGLNLLALNIEFRCMQNLQGKKDVRDYSTATPEEVS